MSEKSNQSRRITKRIRKRERNEQAQSAKMGYTIIMTCVVIMLIGFVLTQQFNRPQVPQPRYLPQDAISASAGSTTWSCPIVGGLSNSDSLVVVNTSGGRDVRVDVAGYSPQGELTGKVSITIAAQSSQDIPISAVGATDSSSVIVDSFGGSIAVFRSLLLSDGNEFISCINSLIRVADIINLTTVRHTNSYLVLSNPYEMSVVVDVSAQLFDDSIQPPRTILDENRGVVIPARGRVSLDLQAVFGRYPVVGVHLEARSGFFAAESLLTYDGADSVHGQTIVSVTPQISDYKPRYWVGAFPTRIASQNNSSHSHAVSITAIGADHRTITPESQTINAGAINVLDNVGADFLRRTLSTQIERSSNNPRSLILSWIHAGSDGVSSSGTYSSMTRLSLVPVNPTDLVHLYNPGNETVTVHIGIFGGRKISRMVEPGSYVSTSLEELGITSDTIIEISSSNKIGVAATSSDATRYINGIQIQP